MRVGPRGLECAVFIREELEMLPRPGGSERVMVGMPAGNEERRRDRCR